MRTPQSNKSHGGRSKKIADKQGAIAPAGPIPRPDAKPIKKKFAGNDVVSMPISGIDVPFSRSNERPKDSSGAFARLSEAGYVIGRSNGREVPIQSAEEVELPDGSLVNLCWSTSLRYADLGGAQDVVETLNGTGKSLAIKASEKLKVSLACLPGLFPSLDENLLHDVTMGILQEVFVSGRYTINHLIDGAWPKDLIMGELHKEQKLVQENAAKSLLKKAVDYPALFRTARSMRRKIIAYLGPTNSGKTFHALNRLAEAGSGAYLGPLRLLALEGQEELFKRGCVASLITGEERNIIEGAEYVSSTVEMANLNKVIDCAVIDEIQMIADTSRGSAWVRAFVGIPAKELIVSGSLDAEDVLKELASALGEEIEFNYLERHSPLDVAPKYTSSAEILPGTAIIAFSRTEVLRIRETLPPEYKAAVIYGNLSPEVRREEAARFRNGDAKVLVATDCIAYGLNLPIKQVLFHTHIKSIARQQVYLDDALVRQIAGRAGRFGFFENGIAGAMNAETLRFIGRCLQKTGAALKPPLMIRPSWTEIEPLIKSSPGINTLCSALRLYVENARFDSKLFQIEPLDDMLALAAVTDRYRTLTLEQRFNISCAPASIDKSPALKDAFSEACAAIAGNRPAKITPPIWKGSTDNSQTLLAAEDGSKAYDLYLWLSWRFPESFPDSKKAESWRGEVNKFISASLKAGVARRCTKCDKSLPPKHEFGICETCFGGR